MKKIIEIFFFIILFFAASIQWQGIDAKEKPEAIIPETPFACMK